MSRISVIVPVYKVEQYLESCLDSILASTYQDLEIILVDDGSPDRCGEICEEYALRDPRIRVVHQENQGLAEARNTGLKLATGEYVGFVDSDDAVSPVMFERLAAVMEQTQADLAACELDSDWSKLVLQSDVPAHSSACFDTYDGQLAVLTCAPAIRPVTWSNAYVWNKLYRRKLIRFPYEAGLLIFEDLLFNWKYIENSRMMAILPEKLYFYRQNPAGIMGTYNSGAICEATACKGADLIGLWDRLTRNSTVTEPALRDYLYGRAAYMSHGGLWRIYCAGVEHSYPDQIGQARRLIHDHTTCVCHDKETYGIKTRAMLLLCRYCYPLWVAAAKLYALKK